MPQGIRKVVDAWMFLIRRTQYPENPHPSNVILAGDLLSESNSSVVIVGGFARGKSLTKKETVFALLKYYAGDSGESARAVLDGIIDGMEPEGLWEIFLSFLVQEKLSVQTIAAVKKFLMDTYDLKQDIEVYLQAALVREFSHDKRQLLLFDRERLFSLIVGEDSPRERQLLLNEFWRVCDFFDAYGSNAALHRQRIAVWRNYKTRYGLSDRADYLYHEIIDPFSPGLKTNLLQDSHPDSGQAVGGLDFHSLREKVLMKKKDFAPFYAGHQKIHNGAFGKEPEPGAGASFLAGFRPQIVESIQGTSIDSFLLYKN